MKGGGKPPLLNVPAFCVKLACAAVFQFDTHGANIMTSLLLNYAE